MRTRGASPKGTTLVELLIATSICLLLSTVLCLCFIQGLRLYQGGEESTSSFREASLALDEMARELGSGASYLFFSTEEELHGSGVPAITLRKYDPLKDKMEVVRYSYDHQTGEILRLLYENDFNEEEPATQIVASPEDSMRVLARNVEALSFSIGADHLFTITITLPGEGSTLRTKTYNRFIPDRGFMDRGGERE